MSDIRARLADALRRKLPLSLTPNTERIVDALLSLPGIAIVDTEDVESAAKALYRDYDDGKTPMNFPWQAIPEVSRENFRRITRLVLAAAAVQAQEPSQ